MASPAIAKWSLVAEESVLTFISIKNTNVAEVHRFHTLSGDVSKSGQLELSIDLASVDTQVPIRDERMRDVLFETGQFPRATLSARLDPAVLQDLPVGQSKRVSTEATLDLHGQSKVIQIAALVIRPNDRELVVTSLQPLILNAADFGLADGVEALRAVVQLPNISLAVPVSFILKFSR
jgi:polyisoprenoid-binding protein YceI